MLTVLSLAASAAEPIGNAEAPPMDAQLFHPAVGGERMLWTEEVGTGEDPVVHSGLLFHYTNDPLQWTGDGGRSVGELTDVMQMDGLFEGKLGRLRLGLDLPVFLYARGADETGVESGSALGDVALSGKLVVLDHRKAPFGLGIGGSVALPTATTSLSLGAEEPEGEVVVSVDEALGRVLFAANVGTLDGPDLELGEHLHINDFLLARLGASVAAGPHTGVSLEVTGRAAYSAALRSDATDAEWLGSTYFGVAPGAQLRLGGGTGLTHGIGSPDFRLVAGFSFAPESPEPQPAAPARREVAEAKPGLAESGDGTADASKENCPLDGPPPGMDVELRFVDQDHVPLATATTRVDGVTDRCGHGIKAEHEVVVQPGARQAPVDFKQDYDLSGTKVSLGLVLAPGDAPKVQVSKDRIALDEEIRFATGSARILPESYGMLDQVALALVQYPEIRRLRIEGHSDARGPDAYNVVLSQARAAAVRDYLVSKGIATDRLRSEGYGSLVPVDPGKGEEAWAKNRRVDLFVEDWED